MAKSYLDHLLGDNEEIKLVTRQHWLILFQNILPEILIMIALIGLITTIIIMAIPAAVIASWAYLILILPLLSLWRDIAIWYNHQYIVTNRRVIQIMGIISKNVTDSSLEKVNDVKMAQSFLGRIFDYADIEILTASEIGVNRFTRIGNPVLFKTAMLNAKENLENRPVLESTNNQAEIPALIAKLDQLRQNKALTEDEFQKKKTELLSKL